MEFLWHKVNEKEKQKIREDAKKILDTFSEKLSKINKINKSLIEKKSEENKECQRDEGKKHCNNFDRKIMFENAPEKNEDFIIAEVKKW